MPPLTRSTASFLRAALAVALLFTAAMPAAALQSGTSPVKIFILAGESNMNGFGRISPDTKKGTLDYLVANDPFGKYQFLKSGGVYATRNDVWIRDHYGIAGNSLALKQGNLTVGYGKDAANIGPELGFGHAIGDAYESQILIVKLGISAATLTHSFCPPSSRVGEPEPVLADDKGFYYKEIINKVNEAKNNLGTYFPDYNGGGYQIAGLAWHQGWNDRVVTAYSTAYETNMANFINDIRSDLAAPNMPVVIASAGMDGNPGVGYSEVEKAQLKMADPVAYPAFAGNVATVDTRAKYEELEFWQKIVDSPTSVGYHWNENAMSYLHIGLASGDAMSLLSPNRIPYRIRGSSNAGGVTLTWKNGTETPVSVRVLRNGVEIAASAPANPPTFTDPSALLGLVDYELQFTMPGSPCRPLTIKHNTGITDLAARLRANGIQLSWKNNLAYSGIMVKRGGTVIAASIPGNTTTYLDPSPPAGTMTYTVEPTDPGSTPAQASRKVLGIPAQTALIYEPFDMTVGVPVRDKATGVGLDDLWTAADTLEVADGSLTFGTLPTFGNSIARTSGNSPCSLKIGTTLSDTGLMDDGAELWFSFLYREPNNTNYKTALILGNDILLGESEISYMGSGIGLRIANGRSPTPMTFNVETKTEGSSQGTLATSQTALIVGKITWGATPSAVDTIQIYTPGTDLVLDTPTSRTAVLDQSNFNVISIFGNGSAPKIDEIRFGASYVDVIGQGIDTSGDFTPPTPATMSFATAPTATSASTITMTATTASDANGVQYRFIETSNNPGATSSDWQDSPVHTDTGLNPSTSYTYTVQARDKSVNLNTNVVSSSVSATTLTPDTNPPPTPGFASGPTSTSSSEITMTATTVTDPEGGGVQYLFTETSGNAGGTSSGWQSSPTYIDSGLSPNTQYTYTIKARDSASPPNESAASSAQSATTLAAGGAGAAVIYEPFAQTVGSALNGQPGGTGLGNWTLRASTDDVIKSGSVSYGSLPVSGNQFNGQARYTTNPYPTLNAAGLMNHGATLWFSAVIQPQDTANRRFVLALSTADIDTGAWTVASSGQCIGFNLQNGQDLQITTASAGTISRNTAQDNLTTATPSLVVGQIIWGADGAANDTIRLYLPGTGLVLPSILDTSTVVVDQSTLDTLVIGYGGGGATKLDEIRFGASYESVIGQGASTSLDHFAISPISSPQTVGTPITGITITAQDSSNNTVTSFTGTVNFGGTGGFTGTSASFTAGVLNSASVIPTVAGNNRTLTVTDSVSGKTGTATITAIRTRYEAWSNGAAFDADSNNDGIDNGMAWVLGATNASQNATGLLPTIDITDPTFFIFNFRRSDAAATDTTIAAQYGNNLGGWTDATAGPDVIITPANDFHGAGIDKVEVKIRRTLVPGGSLFARLKVLAAP